MNISIRSSYFKDVEIQPTNNNDLFTSQFKNETFQSYNICEYKNFTKTCYMIPIYVVKGIKLKKKDNYLNLSVL